MDVHSSDITTLSLSSPAIAEMSTTIPNTDSQLRALSSFHLSQIMHDLGLPTTGISLKSQKIAAILQGEVTQEIKDMKDAPRLPPVRRRVRPSLHQVAEACPVDQLPMRPQPMKKNYRVIEACKIEPGMAHCMGMTGLADQRPLPQFNPEYVRSTMGVSARDATSMSGVYSTEHAPVPELLGQQGLATREFDGVTHVYKGLAPPPIFVDGDYTLPPTPPPEKTDPSSKRRLESTHLTLDRLIGHDQNLGPKRSGLENQKPEHEETREEDCEGRFGLVET